MICHVFARPICGVLLPALLLTTAATSRAADLAPGLQQVSTAAEQEQFAFIMFYRANDTATGQMRRTLQTTLSQRQDATVVPVSIGDRTEQELIERFDATRLPMPAVAVLAPNGAVTSVFPQRVSSQQLTAAIVSTAQAECLKALQDQKIVLLCVQPEGNRFEPQGVKTFREDDHYKDRTQVVDVQATDPAEAKFLKQLGLRTDQSAPLVAFMAPPGVLLGRYNASVTFDVLAQKLAASGKCCDDPNCKHHHSTGGK